MALPPDPLTITDEQHKATLQSLYDSEQLIKKALRALKAGKAYTDSEVTRLKIQEAIEYLEAAL